MTQVSSKSLREIQPQELAGHIREIPTLPVIYQKLLKKMQDPDVLVPEVAQLIARDQALAAKVLHLVNSAFYGYKQQISTVSRAVVILGFRAVRSAALAISVFEYFKDETSNEAVDMTRFWEHSIVTACAAKILAERTHVSQVEEAFVVGLLHDVGKLIQKRYFPADFHEIFASARQSGRAWYETETSLFPVNHASIAKTVFRSWDFPVSVVEAVQLHHLPRSATRFPELTALVHVADQISYELGFGPPGSFSRQDCQRSALQLLGLNREKFKSMLPRIRDEFPPALDILKLTQ